MGTFFKGPKHFLLMSINNFRSQPLGKKKGSQIMDSGNSFGCQSGRLSPVGTMKNIAVANK